MIFLIIGLFLFIGVVWLLGTDFTEKLIIGGFTAVGEAVCVFLLALLGFIKLW